jgi:hypothetical protein
VRSRSTSATSPGRTSWKAIDRSPAPSRRDGDELGARPRPDGRGHPDPDGAGEAPPHRPRAVERVVGGQQRAAARLEQLHAGGRQADLAGGALEQGDAELALELADRLRHRLLAEVQPLGRPREVQLLGDGDERPQLAQLRHARDPRRRVVT